MARPVRPARYLRIDSAGKASFVDVSLTENKAVNANVSLTESKAATAEQKRLWVHEVFENISDDYDRMNDVESFGLHRGWKRTLVRAVKRAVADMTGVGKTEVGRTGGGETEVGNKTGDGSLSYESIRQGTVPCLIADLCLAAPRPADLCLTGTPLILDVACGTGDIALALASAMPECKVVGLDFSANMLAVARQRALAQPLDTALPEFMLGDAMQLPFADNSVAALTISFGLRNLPDYEAALREFARVLAPGASFFCLESSYPTMPLVKPVFKVYFKHIMPRMAALTVGHADEYQWLNDSTEAFLTKAELADMLTACGFENVSIRSFFLGVAALHQATVC